ncbi:MAG: VWA domain-containing protein, partial [Myxococcota bacterium]
MSDFRFAAPEWGTAFTALAVSVALLIWLDRRGGGALDRFVSAALRARLVQSPSPLRRRLRIALLSLSAAALILALMRPQWGMRTVAAPTFGSEIMICLDVSKSMLAEDVAPNRLERAKAEIADLLSYMDGNQVGIIAFAGRATVLSPLTTDFSFLRLVLDNLGPHSVTRGGTRLEEPIRKALKGFGAPGEAARAILLITDGEDQDSFPQDAAKAAAELGVKIIAIGFGDERGSDVFVSNPRTGARELIRDANGTPIRSRLDGDLLRSLALATDGAYVPAGTGLLDLESIYEEHIARLTRGQLSERGKLVRDDIFQWFAMASLVLLVWSVAVPGGRADSDSGGFGIAIAALSVLVPLLAGPLPAHARPEEPHEDEEFLEDSVGSAEENVDTAVDESPEVPPEPEEPREIYNQGIAALGVRDLEQADQTFRNARRGARGDGVLRFRAAYNLGWIAANRAEDLRETEPTQALQSLYQAADWFREAVRLRPEDTASRNNLEVVLNRALMLADAIAKQGEGDLGAKLEALANAQRDAVAAAAGLLERVSEAGGPHVPESLRPAFRANATSQRTLLADTDQLAKSVGDELAAITSEPHAESESEDPMRAAQLEGVLHYMHRARERMGQARQQLRFRQAGRAYRRSAAALAELTRGQDQLRNPVEVLDRVIESVTEIASYTSLLAASQGGLLAAETIPPTPAWLSGGYLLEEQQTAAERTGELHARLQSGLARDSLPDGGESAEIEAIRSATDSIGAGQAALEEAVRELEGTSLPAALRAQIQAIAALREAREHFLDLRGLLETIYADEKRMQAVLSGNGPEDAPKASEALIEFLPSLRSAQRKNLDRI